MEAPRPALLLLAGVALAAILGLLTFDLYISYGNPPTVGAGQTPQDIPPSPQNQQVAPEIIQGPAGQPPTSPRTPLTPGPDHRGGPALPSAPPSQPPSRPPGQRR